MNPKVELVMKSLRRILLLALLALGTEVVFILLIHESSLGTYAALFKGASVGKPKIGTTLINSTLLLLTSIAFAVAAKAGALNVGVEGEVSLGGTAAAYVGIYCIWLPKPLLLVVCFAAAVVAGAAWTQIPGLPKVYYGVSEVCTTIPMNSVALHIISYLISGPISAGVASPQFILVNVTLPKLLKPSNANAGLFIAIAAVIAIIWMLNKTTLDYRIRTVGISLANAEYIGINLKEAFIRTMILSGVIGGLAGCIEVLGTYGYFLNNFAMNLGTNGTLASLIAENNVVTTPFIASSLAVLRSRALDIQQNTGVPKSIVDTITVIFIIVATMELLFQSNKKRKAKADAQQKEDICNLIKFLIFH